MSYEVVARRWRPNTFEAVVGQAHVTRTLANAIERDRVPHAFLFTGIRGVGKTTVARLLSRALNCSNRKGSEPCNECPSCEQGLKGSSVDVIEIDAASNRGIDEVRQLIETAQYRPAMGGYRVYIIDEVHQLSRDAFNALLKILEEPPSHVKFVMATTEAAKLPATVLSRCQRYDFRPVSEADIVTQLEHIAKTDSLAVDRGALGLLAREARGSMRDAQSLLEQVVAGREGDVKAADVAELLGVADSALVVEATTAILQSDPRALLDVLGRLRSLGYEGERFLGEILELLRHVTVAAAAGPDALDAGLGEGPRAFATESAKVRETADLQRIFESLVRTAGEVRRSHHADLVLEMGLLKAAMLEPSKNVSEVLGAIDAALRRGASGAGSGGGGASGGGSGPPRGQARSAPAGGDARRPPARGTAPRNEAAGRVNKDGGGRGDGASARAGGKAPRTETAPAGDSGPPPEHRPPPIGEPVSAGAAPPVGEADGEHPDETGPWETFLNTARDRYGIDLYVTLSSCKAQADADGNLDLVPLTDAFAKRLANRTVFGRVRELVHECYGADVEVRLAEPGSGKQGEGVSMKGIEDRRSAHRKAEALNDPLVKGAIEELGGRVTKVSLLDD